MNNENNKTEDNGHHGHHQGGEPNVEILETVIVARDKATGQAEIIIIDEIIDLEEYAKAKKHPPHAKGYKIRIDREYFTVHVPEMTGRQILELVKKTPEQYLLSQKIHGAQPVPVKADEVVDFRKPGIERFQTLALDPTEGTSHGTSL